MSHGRLIYASRPFGFDEAMLSGILSVARQHNAKHDITGALICRADIYLQMLEGPPEELDALYARIEKDDRHIDPQVLSQGQAEERLFGAWAMRDDPVKSWMWSQEEIADGAVGRASEAEILAVFSRLRSETRAAND